VQLDSAPVSVPVTHPFTGEDYTFLLTGSAFLEGIFGMFYVADFIPYLPYLIAQVHDGKYQDFVSLAMLLAVQGEFISEGMYYSVECYEEAPFNPYEEAMASLESYPNLKGLEGWFSEYEICPTWGAGAASVLETEPVTSDIPTLILSGHYDPITPPAWGQLAAETLSHSTFFEFPGLGHAVTYNSGDCPVEIMVAFFHDPEHVPDARCLERMQPPRFVLPPRVQ